MKQIKNKKIVSIILICAAMLMLCSCGKAVGQTEEQTVWYLGGKSLMAGTIDPEETLKDVENTIDPEKIYASLELSEDMLHGVYMLNNKEKDLDDFRKEVPLEEVKLTENTYNFSVLPTAVYLGSENICNGQTGYGYSEFKDITGCEVAVLELAMEEKVGQLSCVYEVDGNTITFKQILQTSEEGEEFAYELTGVEFVYDFELRGPYMIFSKGENSVRLKAFCFTENTELSLDMSAYALPDSPLVENIDIMSCDSVFNFAIKRDGGSYYRSAYKLDDEGRITIYLEEKDWSTDEVDKKICQYAYIVQSSANSFAGMFNLILLDGTKVYYYTDDSLKRETRELAEQGVDVSTLEEEEIKEIAEKKEDLFEELYQKFEEEGINAVINRSTGEIAMDASVLFGGESSEITSEGTDMLNGFLAAYTSVIYDEKYDGFISKTIVEGHTAPIEGSTYESGLPLSIERAEQVKEYCLSFGTGDVDIEAVGLSNSKPVYDTNGEIDIEASRRVSFRFIVNVE